MVTDRERTMKAMAHRRLQSEIKGLEYSGTNRLFVMWLFFRSLLNKIGIPELKSAFSLEKSTLALCLVNFALINDFLPIGFCLIHYNRVASK